MTIERGEEKALEILFETAASFDHQSEDYKGRAVAWKNAKMITGVSVGVERKVFDNEIESNNRFAEEYAIAAKVLQETVYERMKESFRHMGHENMNEEEPEKALKDYIKEGYQNELFVALQSHTNIQ